MAHCTRARVRGRRVNLISLISSSVELKCGCKLKLLFRFDLPKSPWQVRHSSPCKTHVKMHREVLGLPALKPNPVLDKLLEDLQKEFSDLNDL